jgi:hypothetical protein
MTIILIRINTYSLPGPGAILGTGRQSPRLMIMCTQMLAA